jgi:voltage-gated potassium channel Kch
VSRKTFTLRQQLRYHFDNFMSKGPIALIGGLGLVSLIIILGAGFVISVGGQLLAPEGSGPMTFVEAAWEAMMRTLDAGTMGGDAGWGFRLVMFAVTVGGVFIIATLIGVLTSGVEEKLDQLRKGRSIVVEHNHTVILGWSPQIFSILSELALANENQKSACVVILGDKDKVEMEDEIREKVGDTGHMRIVCRTGSPIDLTDLEIVNLPDSRAIIILTPEVDGNADSHTIKTILAITNNPNRRPEPYHIVAEIRDAKNMDAARLVGKDEAQIILTDDLISRIVAQTCRQSGLSVVYTELLDFGGDEIYIKEEPGLVGKTFGESLFCYEKSAAMGIQFANGRVQVSPPMDTRLQTGDRIIAISEDDDTIILSGSGEPMVDVSAIAKEDDGQAIKSERTLILGWNRRAPVIIHELDNYVAPGSVIKVVADVDEAELAEGCHSDASHNQTITFQSADTTLRSLLNDLDIPSYDYVIVLSSDNLDPQEADARTLVTLLHLRDIADHNDCDFAIVSEMLDSRNRELAEVTRADDFIVSEKLISLMMSQISENRDLAPVFEDLFDPEGVEIYLKPAADYVVLDKPVNFYTIVEAARRRGEVALGYRLRAQSGNAAAGYGVVVNPNKSEQVTFSAADRIVVLAED